MEFYDTARNMVVDVEAPVKYWLDFNGPAPDTTNDVNLTIVNSGTLTSVDGWGILTTGAADDDNVEVASDLIFNGTNFCVMECRLRNDDVSAQAVFAGFTDAITEGADDLPIFYEGDALVTEASDAAGFFQDPDTTADTWRAVAVDTNTDGTAVDTSVTPVNAQIENFRIEIDDSGYCYFWHSTGTTALAYVGSDVAVGVTPGTALCAYVGSINREAAANTTDLQFIHAWGGRID